MDKSSLVGDEATQFLVWGVEILSWRQDQMEFDYSSGSYHLGK